MDSQGSRKGGRLTRQMSSRLKMHAPSSILVAPAQANDVARWNAAIPLLSPLDIVKSAPRVCVDYEEIKKQNQQQVVPATNGTKRSEEIGGEKATWQHPAEPFYYEPAPGNVPVFLLPNCA